ncbi:MAG: alpha/beta hydrolase [Actinomycetota bacterium]
MGEYVELPGVKTWFEVEGAGDPLVLMHGGIVSNELWASQRPDFSAKYQIFLPERRAHGHTPDVSGPLHYTDMAKDTIDFIETVVKQPAHLVGWSDGGNVGLLVAIERPDLVRKLVVTGANFRPGPEIGMGEMLDHMSPDDEGLATFRSMYEAVSPDGPEHWAEFISKIVAMWRDEPAISREELGRISAPTLVLVGDDDMINIEHTVDMYNAIANSELAVVPGTSHGLFMEKTELVNRIVLDFLGNDPVPTMMPVRRAAAPVS